MKGKVTIFLRVPVETWEISWRHDCRQPDGRSGEVMRREDEEPWDGNEKKKKRRQRYVSLSRG